MLLLTALAFYAGLGDIQDAGQTYTPWAKVGPWVIVAAATNTACFASFEPPSTTGKISAAITLAKGVVSGKNFLAFSQDPPIDLRDAELSVLSGKQLRFSKAAGLGPDRLNMVVELSDQEVVHVAAGDEIEIGNDDETLAALHYPEGLRVVTMLRRCAREKGDIDRGSGKPAATKPVLLTAAPITSNDYPAEAVRDNAAGRTSVELTVSAKGKVSDCRITATSGNVLLDETTCSLLSRRGRFTPGADSSGAPTESKYQRSVTWAVPS